jgi:hypothetical protein
MTLRGTKNNHINTGEYLEKTLMFAAASLLACAVQAANPILPKLYTADPAAFVENGTVYLYVGHDQASPTDKDYVMKEWRLYSSCDMKNWVIAVRRSSRRPSSGRR